MNKNLKFHIFVVGVFFMILSYAVYANEELSPRFSVDFNVDKQLNLIAGSNNSYSFDVSNLDENRKILLFFSSELNGKEGWFGSNTIDFLTLDELSSNNFDFNLNIPFDACNGLYKGAFRVFLVNYVDIDSDNCLILEGNLPIFIAVGYKFNINVSGGQSCNPLGQVSGLTDSDDAESLISIFNSSGGNNLNNAPVGVVGGCNDLPDFSNQKLVYHDFNGDENFITFDGDKLIDQGTATLYDSSDTLISTTDLSVTNGVYAVPSTALSGTEDFYLVVETDKWDDADPSIKDTLWEGNLFVDRTGSYASQQNVYLIEDVSSFSEIIHNIDVRSRNTDQSGTWDAGSITVGPDDKDQIISPIHWDQLVAGTDFPYVDLDHDGRIDPDDKDHVISPLYWDFPN